MERKSLKLAAGAEIFEYNNRLCYKYNAKVKIAGDSAKVMFFEKGVMCGFSKNKLEGEARERAKFEYDEAAREARYDKTCRKARRTVYDIVACNLGKHRDYRDKKQSFKFLTLTFRNDVKKIGEANKLFKAFIMRLNYHYTGSKASAFLKYVAVPELQTENGRDVWHFHVLFFNMPFLPVSGEMVDKLISDGRLFKGYDKRHTIAYIWGSGSVHVCAVPFHDAYDVAGYISKYVAKGLTGVLEYAEETKTVNKKKYLQSSGLNKPRVIVAFFSKRDRQDVFSFFSRNSKHFKERGEVKKRFESFFVKSEYVGNVFGFSFRASLKRLSKLESLFEGLNYGF